MWGLGIAVLAFSVLFVVARGVVDFRDLPEDRTSALFDSLRTRLGDRPPMLEIDEHGESTRQDPLDDRSELQLSRLGVLAYRASDGKLAEADVPFWFVRLKSPALEFILRDTRVNLEELGIRASDLQRHGPGTIVDRLDANGDRLLIWVE